MRNLQLEVLVLLSLHWCDLVRPPQIARCRLSVEVYTRKDRDCRTASLLAEEHLCSRETGGIIFSQMSRMTLKCQTKLEIQPLCDSAFADIKSKVSSDNIADESFSWVTAG